jgi:hypothetical protein
VTRQIGFSSLLPLVADPNEYEEVVHAENAPPPNSRGRATTISAKMVNWLEAMRDRKQPNATVDHGFSHAIVCIMAAESYWSAKRLYWDPQREEILDQPV